MIRDTGGLGVGGGGKKSIYSLERERAKSQKSYLNLY